MKIDIVTIGNITIHGYGLMIGIGFVLAILLGTYRAKKMGLKEDSIIDIAIIAGISGFLGAKLLFIIVNIKDFIKSPMSVLGSSGFVVYGGLIAGIIAGWLYVKIKKLSFLEYFDLVMPEIALAQCFGRLGCFMAGCCYGRVTTSKLGVIFPADSLAPSGIRLIPTQLISAGANLLNVIVLITIAHFWGYTAGKNRKLAKGDIGAFYLVFYGIGRFLIEFLRDDHRGAVGILSTSQFISVFFVLMGVAIFVINGLHSKSKSK